MNECFKVNYAADYAEAWGASESRMKALGLSYLRWITPTETDLRRANRRTREHGSRHNHTRRKNPIPSNLRAK